MLDSYDDKEFYFQINLYSMYKEFSVTSECINKNELLIELTKWDNLAKKAMEMFDLPECSVTIEVYLSHNDKYKGILTSYTINIETN